MWVAFNLSWSCLLVTCHVLSKIPSTIQQRSSEKAANLDVTELGIPRKYFHESTFSSHYDVRFGQRQLHYYEQRRHLSALVRSYLSMMGGIGAETWLMHGSLLGWYWNRKIMPWDSDIDVQITEKSMQHLAEFYNMTVHRFNLPNEGHTRDYLLEINPNWANPSTTDSNNKIDARWLDMTTGLYVDITTLRRDLQAEASGTKGALMCKDKHRYIDKDIFPLRDTMFENVPAKVPFAYADVLTQEYGASSLQNTIYMGHRFDTNLQEWLPFSPSESF